MLPYYAYTAARDEGLEPIALRSHRGYAGLFPPNLEFPIHPTGSSSLVERTNLEPTAALVMPWARDLSRTGANRYFPTVPDGWIRIACGRL